MHGGLLKTSHGHCMCYQFLHSNHQKCYHLLLQVLVHMRSHTVDHVIHRAHNYIIIMRLKIDVYHMKVALPTITLIIPIIVYKHVDKHVWVSGGAY